MNTNEKIKQLHNEFVKANGNEPKFADVVVLFDGESKDDEFSTLIKLRGFNPANTENDPDDGNVIFYCDGLEELLQINNDGIADFQITDINGFCDQYK